MTKPKGPPVASSASRWYGNSKRRGAGLHTDPVSCGLCNEAVTRLSSCDPCVSVPCGCTASGPQLHLVRFSKHAQDHDRTANMCNTPHTSYRTWVLFSRKPLLSRAHRWVFRDLLDTELVQYLSQYLEGWVCWNYVSWSQCKFHISLADSHHLSKIWSLHCMYL